MAEVINKYIGGWKSDNGSITLEASLVVPWVLIMTFLVMLLAIAVADRASVYYSVSAAADRAAFAWPHSSADVRTGAYPIDAYDGLYWRLKEDALLAGLFGWGAESSTVRVAFGSDGNPGAAESPDNTSGGSLTEAKLQRSADRLAYLRKGAAGYRNQVWRREVTMDADGGVPSPLEAWGWSGSAGSTSALVTEPAESIRTYEMLRYFRAKMSSKGSGAAAYRKQAAAVLAGKR